jgi:hypothetical protein
MDDVTAGPYDPDDLPAGLPPVPDMLEKLRNDRLTETAVVRRQIASITRREGGTPLRPYLRTSDFNHFPGNIDSVDNASSFRKRNRHLSGSAADVHDGLVDR